MPTFTNAKYVRASNLPMDSEIEDLVAECHTKLRNGKSADAVVVARRICSKNSLMSMVIEVEIDGINTFVPIDPLNRHFREMVEAGVTIQALRK